MEIKKTLWFSVALLVNLGFFVCTSFGFISDDDDGNRSLVFIMILTVAFQFAHITSNMTEIIYQCYQQDKLECPEICRDIMMIFILPEHLFAFFVMVGIPTQNTFLYHILLIYHMCVFVGLHSTPTLLYSVLFPDNDEEST